MFFGYLFRTRLTRSERRTETLFIDRFVRLLSFLICEGTSLVKVRSKSESKSKCIDEISIGQSGVGERLVVQPVDVFKPESVVVMPLGNDEHGEERR